MKHPVILMLVGITLFLSDLSSANNDRVETHVATCTGSKNCYACKNCKYCAYCNAGGGTCGICSSSASQVKTTVKPKKENNSSVSSQCKGTTKKGARCKRMVKGGGYCWQHG